MRVDAGMSLLQGAQPAIEAMQMGPQAVLLELPWETEILQFPAWADVPSLTAQARAIAATMPEPWGTIINHGTVYGVGGAPPTWRRLRAIR